MILYGGYCLPGDNPEQAYRRRGDDEASRRDRSLTESRWLVRNGGATRSETPLRAEYLNVVLVYTDTISRDSGCARNSATSGHFS
ncbi:MAG: hypothetical protein OHK0029_28990 [Armatimonadaceae bacterium]